MISVNPMAWGPYMLRKFVCGSRLLHPIHGRGVFQRSNIISNLTGALAYRGFRGSLPLALGEPPEAKD